MMLTDVDIHAIGEACHYENHMGCYAFNALGLRKFTAKAIEANNAKVLTDLKPLAGYAEIVEYEGLVYSADTVSALIQRNAELEARLRDIDLKAEAGLCAGTFAGSREFLKDIRNIVSEMKATP